METDLRDPEDQQGKRKRRGHGDDQVAAQVCQPAGQDNAPVVYQRLRSGYEDDRQRRNSWPKRAEVLIELLAEDTDSKAAGANVNGGQPGQQAGQVEAT